MTAQIARAAREAAWRASLVAAFFSCVFVSAAGAQESFATIDEATTALINAARAGDRTGILTILGRAGANIVASGDPVADAAARERFVAAYDARHQINIDGSKAIVLIGTEDFPFPIPLIRKGERWHFDVTAGRREILYRRIGRNELAAIQSCLAYVDAQNEYADKDRTGDGAGIYAQRIVSQPGLKDGLYWATGDGKDESPLGELVAEATTEGYNIGGVRAPFHGYYYKILTKQGSDAPGGALDYVVQGKMIGGYALVAYPAEYGNSGVMTFLVNHTGTVYEKDLGPRTAALAEGMASFNPDHTWKESAASAPE